MFQLENNKTNEIIAIFDLDLSVYANRIQN